jgi:hypothetical protein
MLDAVGDYTFGQGSANFWIDDPQGVAQSVITRLELWTGEWFLDKTVGTPYAQQILGYGTKNLYDMALRTRILGTSGVTALLSYASEEDPDTRLLTITDALVQTLYSATPVQLAPVVL